MTFCSLSGGTDAVGRPAATGSAEHDPGAVPALQPAGLAPGVPLASGWPLRSHLELGAFPSAVPCARLHARHVMREWGLATLADTVELLVSEILTNAVRASASLPGGRRNGTAGADIPTVRLWLAANQQWVLIQVWDSCQSKPQRQEPALDAEGGRGLLLVQALSTEWGEYVADGWTGKIVWSMVETTPTPRSCDPGICPARAITEGENSPGS